MVRRRRRRRESRWEGAAPAAQERGEVDTQGETVGGGRRRAPAPAWR